MSLIQAMSDAAGHHDEERFRYYGVVSGVVTTLDSDGLGRVKARLKGMPDDAETDWLAPAWPGGIEGVPHKKDPVLVMFEDGNENKGAYLWFPSSKTKDRPNEAAVLGLTFAAMYNDLVTQFNQLRSDMAAHTHLFGTIACSTGVISGATATKVTTATAAGKMQKHDGSAVTAASGDKKALSGRVKVGI